MKKLTILLSMAVLTLSAQANSTPSWCKSKNLKTVEQYICDSQILGSADTLLNELYKSVMSYKGKEGQEGMWAGEVKGSQVEWIKERNKLEDEDEVLGSYMGRIDDLYATLKEKQARAVSVVYDNITDIYDAVVNDKAEDLANLISFPKTVMINGKSTKFKDKKAFLKAYPKVFTKKYRETVAKAKANKKDMFSNYKGIMLGDGSIWFDEDGHLKSLNTMD